MPDTVADYKKQRFRWAFGAMKIMQRHRADLLWKSGLSPGQRYHFIAGWLPWLADGFNLLFSLGALAWSMTMVWFPLKVDPPSVAFTAVPLIFFGFKLIKMFHLYTTRLGAGLRQTLAAALAGLALSHVIGLAMLTGLMHKEKAFFRTPKMVDAQALANALAAARQEILCMLALWLAAYGVTSLTPMNSPDAHLWVIMLLIQSVPYAASALVAVISGIPRLPARLLGRSGSMEEAAAGILARNGRSAV